MIAFVRPSLLLLASIKTGTVLVSKLDFKLGTVLDRELGTVLDNRLGSELGTVTKS
jgi:hypothetical protein